MSLRSIPKEFWSCTLIRDSVIDFLHRPEDDDRISHPAIVGLLVLDKMTFKTVVEHIYKEVQEFRFQDLEGKEGSLYEYMLGRNASPVSFSL